MKEHIIFKIIIQFYFFNSRIIVMEFTAHPVAV